jgi:glucosamine 6-phosphate synthetase-like amidotransferase/phosphosugar isomerase protein
LIFPYAKNTVCLREQDQKDKIQISQLQQQFAYYQEKLKEEEKVRSLYHDMKNHLLVLQRQINSPVTAEMVEKLQS